MLRNIYTLLRCVFYCAVVMVGSRAYAEVVNTPTSSTGNSLVCEKEEVINEHKGLSMNQASVIESVIYQTKASIKDKDHIKKALAITPILAKFNGFVSRQFSKATTDGKWIDIVYWTDLSSAEKAADAVKNIPECQIFFADIDPQTMELRHSNILFHYP